MRLAWFIVGRSPTCKSRVGPFESKGAAETALGTTVWFDGGDKISIEQHPSDWISRDADGIHAIADTVSTHEDENDE